MSKLRMTYDGPQHGTALQTSTGRSVATDACPATGGKGEELSPGELVGSGLAGCMLFSMGLVAQRDQLDLTGTTVDVEVTMLPERIGAIDLVFGFPRHFSAQDRTKLQRATEACPIKRSFRPEVEVSSRFTWPERAPA